MLMTTLVGISGYLIAGWTLIDAIFMVVITIFGVGYGEVQEEGPRLRVFTMGIILAGCTSLIYLIGGFIQFLTEGEIQKLMGTRRMNAEIEKLRSHAIICGFGRIGRVIADDLTRAGTPFVVIDNNHELAESDDTNEMLLCFGNATEDETLLKAGIEHASVLATVLPSDASNVFITLSARNLNASLKIIARGESPRTEAKLFQAGADRVVMPAQIGAERIAHQILHPHREALLESAEGLKVLDSQLGDLGIHIRDFDIPEDSSLVGTNLGKVESSTKDPFLVVAVHRAEGKEIVHPKPDTVIQSGDRLLLISHNQADLELTSLN